MVRHPWWEMRFPPQKDVDAIERDRQMIVKTLVMRGANFDLRNQHNRTALEIARMNHQSRISEVLITSRK
jgi:ankyrin repeat protein